MTNDQMPNANANGTEQTAAQIAAQVKDLATLPTVYFRIREELQSPTATLASVADALSTDPVTASRVLRLANSAFYGRAGTVSTLTRAVGLVGTQQVHDLVLATALIGALRDIPAGLANLRDFWTISVMAGAAAKLLAERCGILDCERLFVVGLLAQLGQLVLYLQLPEEMRIVMTTVQREQRAVQEVERERLGFDYAAVSAELLNAWQLPAELVAPIRHHTEPMSAQATRLESAIVQAAVQLAIANQHGRTTGDIVAQLDPDAWRLLDLRLDALEEVRADARILAGELGQILLQAA